MQCMKSFFLSRSSQQNALCACNIVWKSDGLTSFEVYVTAGYNVGCIFALLYNVSIGIGRDKRK